MNISLNPTYYCNFRCNFCYLTEQQLSDRKLLDIETLDKRLAEIESFKSINHIDLYGGEVSILPEKYLEELKICLQLHGIKSVNVNTNLSNINRALLDPFFYISVSYDFSAREQHDRVWKNMALLTNKFSVLMLASPAVLSQNVDNMIEQFNLLSNLASVEIKPYSKNQANDLNVGYKEFENFVKCWIESPIDKNFEFVNEYLIQDVLSKTRNSFSDDHIYITSSGKFAVLEFDLNDREYFQEYSSFEEYLDWCKKEKNRVKRNKFCSECNYFGNCLSEHLREVKNLDNSCNGFKGLIEWYRNNYNK